MQIGVVGLGVMGQGMAANLAQAGLLSVLWNRTSERASAVADRLNVPAAADLTEVAANASVIVTCVSADADVEAVVDRLLPHLGPTHTVIDTSTIAVTTAEALAERIQAAGAAFIDAPVTGGAEGAQAGTLQLMIGGAPEAVARMQPVFAAIGSAATHFGPVGYGQRAKAVNQVLAAGMVQAMSEALAFADASGLDTAALLPVLSEGAVGSRLLERRGQRMLAEDFTPGFRIALHHKDLRLCQQLLRDLNVNLPLVEMTLKHYERLLDSGYGDEDMTALYRLKRELFRTGNRRSL